MPDEIDITQIRGMIFNIQKFSVHDGRGIRTLVFLKGCPLRCKWCSNPESQNAAREVSRVEKSCVQCGKCVSVCRKDALSWKNGAIFLDRQKCSLSDDCACLSNCVNEVFGIYGKECSTGDIIRRVKEDEIFYRRSAGGLTVGGGEPMSQASFTIALLKLARMEGIDTNMETCAHAQSEKLLEAATCLDSIYMDVKILDSAKHKEWTGVGNALILENIKLIASTFPSLALTIRTPIIPGFNDNVHNVAEIAEFAAKYAKAYELLPYHHYGEAKYRRLGRKYKMGDIVLDQDKFTSLKRLIDTN